MENNEVVNDQLTPGQASDATTKDQEATEEVNPESTQVKAGDKTPPNELLLSLQDKQRRISQY